MNVGSKGLDVPGNSMRSIATAIAVVLIAGSIALSVSAEDSFADEMERTKKLAQPLAKRSLRWRCTPTVLHVCNATACEKLSGEKKLTSPVSVRLDFSENSYSRCDAKGCDSYPMEVLASGIFTTVALPGRPGIFLKALNDGSEYVEVASLHLGTYQNFGSCKRAW